MACRQFGQNPFPKYCWIIVKRAIVNKLYWLFWFKETTILMPEMHLEMPSVKWRPSYPYLCVIKHGVTAVHLEIVNIFHYTFGY